MKILPALAFLATPALAEVPVLNVLTYDSFTAEWGPGPAIAKGFEATCACKVNYIAAGDGGAILSRLKMEGAGSEADVALGLDTSLVEAARATGLFAPIAAQPNTLPVPFADTEFQPYDWGWFAFVHLKSLENPPANFKALAASDLKIVIQDPRSSTPGLGLVMWVKAAYGDEAGSVWKDLADNIVTVTPGWDEAYGLFLKGEADMVLSYTTSPAYHLIAENDDTKTAALFDEGHYMQVEVAGKLKAAPNPELADAFLAYLAGTEAQSVIPTTNWMYPAQSAPLPQGFETLIQPAKSLLLSPTEAEALRQKAIEEWQAALAQ
ncbi:thiamine ABC transporter substrate binding subunit [Stagnihabitans tardus]|uniref:Thiamine ABC transporter substrate binding subunit n=1 Tax=Stagnihabitans tardus TaxID=2699202 RepID=A0AAE4Y668_9RHOB|nr:thiamine ABC transporter substrate binding subunit [Stagnihabitans tardus]NBZ86548.1 thiamine ABC transporter substrate binding subunit [Stagnihabitans tardus]